MNSGLKEDRVAFNMRLILEVEKRVPLWNAKHPDYKDNKLVTVHWQEIASILSLSVKEVNERWRNLRDTYVRILKKIKTGKKTQVSWPYFNKLMFLQSAVSHRRKDRSKIVDGEESSHSAASTFLKNEQQTSDEDCSSFQETWFDVNSHLQLQLESEENSDSSCSPHLQVQKRKHISNFLTDDYYIRQKIPKHDDNEEVYKVPKHEENDEIDMFLKSLAPHLRKVPSHLYGLCQMNMLQVAVSFAAGIVPNNLYNPFNVE